MLLIADSGSTKTEWCLVNEGVVSQQIFTKGINPFYQTENEIVYELEQNLIPKINMHDVSHIYFYGAGCSFPERKAQVGNALKHFFESTDIEVESDLLGAARSMFQHDKGIACILGTGSNSCYYDGSNIVDNVSPLGFILGDEGSGAVLCKKFVADCLKNQISTDLSKIFMEEYKLTPAIILDKVYKQAFPNRFLASFTPFLAANIHNKQIYNLVYSAFCDFFQRNVMQYNYTENAVRIIGSVAFYFSSVLQKAASDCGVSLMAIQQSPMSGLVDFHK